MGLIAGVSPCETLGVSLHLLSRLSEMRTDLRYALQGFAYVEFEARQGLQNAVDMTGVEFQGKLLQIKISGPQGGGKPPGPGRGRGRGERGRGRGNPGGKSLQNHELLN